MALRRQRIISGDFEAWAHNNKLVIKNFGSIEQCELDSSSFSVLAGHQTLDMSGVAKCVYFFRTVKDELRDVIVNGNPSSNTEILDIVSNRLLMKFRVMFDPQYYSNALMRLVYSYSDHVSLEVINIAGELRILFSPNMVSVLKSKDLYALSLPDLQYCLNTVQGLS